MIDQFRAKNSTLQASEKIGKLNTAHYHNKN